MHVLGVMAEMFSLGRDAVPECLLVLEMVFIILQAFGDDEVCFTGLNERIHFRLWEESHPHIIYVIPHSHCLFFKIVERKNQLCALHKGCKGRYFPAKHIWRVS